MSLERRAWASLILGCSPDKAFIWRACFTDRGINNARTAIVNTIMLISKLLKNILYRSARLLIIGLMIHPLQRIPITSTYESLFPLHQVGPVQTQFSFTSLLVR